MIRSVAAFTLILASLALAVPPKVAKSSIENGQESVDPALTELRVEFDQPMNTGGRSIVGGGETFPVVGNPRWANAKTILIPLKLQPEREYWLSINNDTFKNFINKAGESAEPYPIQFFTAKAAGGKAAASAPASNPVAANDEAIQLLKTAIDENYAYRDRLKVDWDKQFASHLKKLEEADTPNAFARAVASMMRVADDAHVWVKAGDVTIGTHVNTKPPNFNLAALKQVVPGWKERAPGIATGRFADGIGYILIPQWAGQEPDAVDEAIDAFKDCKALVIDVRPNGGGDEPTAQKVAGRFVPAARTYSKNRIRKDGQWLGPFDRVIEPRADKPRWDKPVALLIGPKCASSNESFILMMKQDPQCVLVGSSTKGSSGNPRPCDLGNGVTVFLSSWEDQLPDGSVLEGKGVAPDVEVRSKLADFMQRDPVLDAALTRLREAKQK